MPESAKPISSTPLLTRGEMARGLRLWLYKTSAWGIYDRVGILTGPIFVGFALYLGATDAQIGMMASVFSGVGLIQVLLVLFVSRVRKKKRFVILVGLVEVVVFPSIVFIPLLFPRGWWIPAVFVCLVVASVSVSTMLPLYNSWLASLLPSTSRARYLSRLTIVSTLTAIVGGYALGRFIDLFEDAERYQGFFVVFLIGLLGGVVGYVILTRCPYPRADVTDEEIKPGRHLFTVPLRNSVFMRFLVCRMSWVFATGIAQPFYSVFMIKTLQISYSTIAIFTNLSLVMQIVGFRVWSGLVDRYGSKPILQLLTVPFAFIPLLWVFNRSDSYYLIPFIMLAGGILISGIQMAAGSMFYDLIPTGSEQPVYFAFRATVMRLMMAVAPLLGGSLVALFHDFRVEIAGFPVENLQVVFVVSGLLIVVPIVLLRGVTETRSKDPGVLVDDLRQGNFLRFAYSQFRLSRAKEEGERGRAMRSMGRSRSPMALEQLAGALDDVSPYVRSQAAAALGEVGDPRALDSLLEELSDRESDIRPQVIEALGKLGHPRGLDPLIESLHDADPRVRISAIRALSAMEGEEARELLFWSFCDPFDRSTFPTLVEVLSDPGDTRIVKPTLDKVSEYRSPVIRLQLLNGACRAMGAGNLFYRMLSLDDYERADRIGGLVERARASLASSRFLSSKARSDVTHRIREALLAYEGEDQPGMGKALRAGIDLLSSDLAASDGRRKLNPEALERTQVGTIAIRTFLDRDLGSGLVAASEIFPVVCLYRIAQILKRGRIQEWHPLFRWIFKYAKHDA